MTLRPEILEPARWRGGPLICPSANLPAFESARACRDFMDNLPAVKVDRIWQCEQCGGFHAVSHIRASSGDSSGSSTQELTRVMPEHIRRHNAEISRRRNLARTRNRPPAEVQLI